MAGVSRQKQKLLRMEELFRTRTDESHAITGGELIKILNEMGIKAERKTIYDDIATLCDAGLDIRTAKSGHSNAYYMGSRLFDDEELRTLANTVAASRYLTIKKSGELIRKLQMLTSEHKAAQLKRAVHIENRTKSSNDPTYAVVDVVQEAMQSDRAVEYYSSEIMPERRARMRRSVLSPYSVVLERERYYIIGKTAEGIVRLRADKLTECIVSPDKRAGLSSAEEFEVRRLRLPSERRGGEERVRIRFDAEAIDEVYERFGERAVQLEEDGACVVETEVQLSPEFWGWLFMLGTSAKVISPVYVAEKARRKAENIAAVYR